MVSFANEEIRAELQRKYASSFKATFAPCTHFIGIDVQYDREHGVLKLTQGSYIKRAAEQLLSADELAAAAPSTPSCKDLDKLTGPQELGRLPKCSASLHHDYRVRVGTLLYISVTCMPGLAHCAGKLGRASANPSERLRDMTNQALRWVYHHREEGLEYRRDASAELVAHSDSDWCIKHAAAAWVVALCGAVVSWASKRERCVALDRIKH